MKKVLIGIGITLLVIVIVVIIAINFFAGSMIKAGVEKFAPDILGVPVTVENVYVGLLRGKVSVTGLVVGNPEKFKSDYLFSLGKFSIKIDLKSLSTDTIIINKIIIKAPEISYELALGSSNIGTLLDGLKKEDAEEQVEENKKEQSSDTEAVPGKKLIIEKILLTDGTVSVNISALGGKGATLPLPKVEITDIGKEKEGGANIVDVVTEVIYAISSSVLQVVSGSMDLLGDSAKAAIGAAGDVAGIAGDAAKATVGIAGDATKATVGAAEDVAGATVGAAGDAAKNVGKGASKLVGGVTGMFKKDKNTDTEEK
jgi:uncharacterized protein involved in outer membrane biogenesis